MKILPKKIDLDKARAQEQKQLIDDGLALAQRVDLLRRTVQDEEKKLLDLRMGAVKDMEVEIAGLNAQKCDLTGVNEQLRLDRIELLKPLDNEWIEINKQKDDIKEITETLFIEKEQIKQDRQLLEKEEDKITDILQKAKKNEKETGDIKKEIEEIKILSQNEYEKARKNRIEADKIYDKKIKEVEQREKEYVVALNTIGIREKQVSEKESELLLREQHLASQQVALQIAMRGVK